LSSEDGPPNSPLKKTEKNMQMNQWLAFGFSDEKATLASRIRVY